MVHIRLARKWYYRDDTYRLIELPDHRLHCNSRTYEGWEGMQNVRLNSYSSDAGSTWGNVLAEPSSIDYGFTVECSMASAISNGITIFVHALDNTRRNITLYQGVDDTEAMQVVWDTIQIYKGLSEYSDVVVLNPQLRVAGVVFESTEYQVMSFSLVPLNYLAGCILKGCKIYGVCGVRAYFQQLIR